MRAALRHLALAACALLLACAGKAPVARVGQVAPSVAARPVNARPAAASAPPLLVASSDAPALSSAGAAPCLVDTHGADLSWVDDTLHVGMSAPPALALSPKQSTALANGTGIRVTVRVYAFPDPIGAPTTVAARVCALGYDLWNEVYVVQTVSGGTTAKMTFLPKAKAFFDRCLRPALAVINRSTLGTTSTTLGVIIDVGPASALLTNVAHRARLGRGYGPLAPTDPLFASFTDLFCTPSPTSTRFLLTKKMP